MKSNPNWSFNHLTGLYPVQRTLAFKAVPVWETRRNIDAHCIIEKDKQLAEDAALVKDMIKRENQRFIQSVLSGFAFKYVSEGKLDSIEEYLQLFSDRSEKGQEAFEKVKENLKKAVEKAFSSYEEDGVKVLSQMAKPQALLTKVLPLREMTEEEKQSLERVQKFTTYFMDIVSRYVSYYKADQDGHTIPNRIVEDNFPILVENRRVLEIVRTCLGETFEEACGELLRLTGISVKDCLLDDTALARINSQYDIEQYNTIIGGAFVDNGMTKAKGLNEVINLYNQTMPPKKRIPKLKDLNKQILTEREPISWLPEVFHTDDELVSAVREMAKVANDAFNASNIEKLVTLLNDLDSHKEGIFIDTRRITDVSHKATGRWDAIERALADYLAETGHITRKKKETDEDFRKRIWKSVENRKAVKAELVDRAFRWDNPTMERSCLSVLKDLPKLMGEANLAGKEMLTLLDEFVRENLNKAKNGKEPDTLMKKQEVIDVVKFFLDSLKTVTRTFACFTSTVSDENPDTDFYDIKKEMSDRMNAVLSPLYDKTRNYLTKRPGGKKLAINASNAVLFDGIDVNMEKVKCGVFFKKGESVYAGILIKRNCTESIPEDESSEWKKINFKFLGKAYQMVPKVCISTAKAIERFHPSEEVLDLYERRKTLDPTETARLVQYFIDCISSGIYDSWNSYHFVFKPAAEYATLNDFYNDVQDNSYCSWSVRISEQWLRDRVAAGDILLFEITNRYMKENRRGRDDKTKRILRYAFSEENLAAGNVRICGGEKLTYREPSIEKKVTHPAGVPMANKNPDNPNPSRTLGYDLYKDKRYMEEQFTITIPVVLNNNAPGWKAKGVNSEINRIIRETPALNVLGINRGENNLITYAVTAPDGTILEQGHLNTIDGYNYQALLASLERSRTKSRQDWTALESIKDTKAGYLSLATTEILSLAAKWNCVIAMESLAGDFKERRQRFERNVYQQFERDLCTRLQFCEQEDRHILEGLQLSRGDLSIEESNSYYQNGVLFFVNPWMISRTVPGQPFIAVRYIETDKLEQAKSFFAKLKKAVYDKKDNVFEFTFPESAIYDLPEGVPDQDVTICTYGERVINRKDYTNYNTPVDEIHLLSQEMMKALQDEGITISGDMAEAITSTGKLSFYQKVAGVLNLAMRPTSLYAAQRNKEYRINGCVRLKDGSFYDSRFAPDGMPKDGDALAAWNVARKCHIFLRQIRESGDAFPKLSLSNADWIKFVRNA